MLTLKTITKSVLCLLLIIGGLAMTACSEEGGHNSYKSVTLSSSGRYGGSTTAGNLLATAIKEVHNLDIVFVPTLYLKDSSDGSSFTVTTGMSEEEIEDNVYKFYNTGSSYINYITGTVSGANIKRFIFERCMINANCDVQVAGLKYNLVVSGGIDSSFNVTLEDGTAIEDDTYYKVAFNSKMFSPWYQWRHNMEYDFYDSLDVPIDSIESLTTYLMNASSFAGISLSRALVQNNLKGTKSGTIPIYTIQGVSHLSDYLGYRVTTTGIVTGTGQTEEGEFEFYIQDKEGDGNRYSSDALYGYFNEEEYSNNKDLIDSTIIDGAEIEITGVVSEDYTEGGMTRTSIRFISNYTQLSTDNELPEAVTLGEGGDYLPPSSRISSYIGDVNTKTILNLEDGMDFWESLEGMRVTLLEPRVTGFYGGNSKTPYETRTYISLNVVVKGFEDSYQKTAQGGMVIDVENDDYNPEMIEIIDNYFWQDVWAGGADPSDCYFTVGDEFGYDVEGILAFGPNFFGEGQYVLYSSTAFGTGTSSGKVPFSQRDVTELEGDSDHITIASYNLLNLGGDSEDNDQREMVAESIVVNLKSPDILCLVEVQDNNGAGFAGGSEADISLEKLIAEIETAGAAYSDDWDIDYEYINIDPELNADGGEPGGNIRVAFIYNQNRVGFEKRGDAGALDEITVNNDGSISLNPGRIAVGHWAFDGSRKSIAAEFTFNGEKILVVGNHLKSKRGDTSMWGNEQPVVLSSETKRNGQAEAVHDFVGTVLNKDSDRYIVVAGDFNEYYAATPMRTLEGDYLSNLLELLLPFEERYTYNYNGNSQAIDHILTSKSMYTLSPEVDAVHINSDYMYKASDHDAVISRFEISSKK